MDSASAEWQTIARIESSHFPASQLIVQYGSAALDFADDSRRANEIEASFLYNRWLIDARRHDPHARLILHEQDGSVLDASGWTEEQLQQWIDERRQDFLVS